MSRALSAQSQLTGDNRTIFALNSSHVVTPTDVSLALCGESRAAVLQRMTTLNTLGPTNLGHNKFGYHNFGYHNFSHKFRKFLVYNNFSHIF